MLEQVRGASVITRVNKFELTRLTVKLIKVQRGNSQILSETFTLKSFYCSKTSRTSCIFISPFLDDN